MQQDKPTEHWAFSIFWIFFFPLRDGSFQTAIKKHFMFEIAKIYWQKIFKFLKSVNNINLSKALTLLS